MSRVLLVGRGPPETGGIAAYLTALEGGLSRRHRVHLLNLTREHEPPAGGRFTLRNLGRTLADVRLVHRASRGHDVVHIHSALAPMVTLLRAGLLAAAARARGCRTIVHAHGGRVELWMVTPVRRLLARIVLRPAHRVVAVSLGGASALARAVGERRSALIQNGIDLREFAPDSHQGPGSASNAPATIAYAGIITARKGLIDLIEASRLLAARGVPHRLMMAGGRPDEGTQAEAEVRAAAGTGAEPKTEAEGDIRFLGPLPHQEMPGFYRDADVFCLPSWWEAMPLSILEAMAAGLPVVATEVGDIPRLVEDGSTGILVPPKRPKDLAAALERLLLDPDERRRMGAAGLVRARERFGLDGTIGAVEALYAELLHTRGGARAREP
jgi:glycosyltransferase involved in cell wall biosynthesis